jgi:CPA1 family monovalent cation:H+ antiporter
MTDLEAILVLLAATTALVAIAQKINVPYPALLVLGGLAIGFAPGMPTIELNPDYVFILVLPPILQSAAFFTPIRDLHAQIRPILSLALGLVFATTLAVALVAHWLVDGMSWPAAFALGAIVSPPDAVAATSIASRLRLPRRLVTILEGESLINDASALVSYRVAVAAGVTGAFSLLHATGEFVLVALGGIAVGLIASWIMRQLLMRATDTSILIAMTVIAPYATYILAEHLEVSGVLAVVVLGLVLGRSFGRFTSPEARIQSLAFWKMFIFLLNGFVFILMGLQLPDVLDGVDHLPTSTLIGNAVLLCLTVIGVRIAWVALTSDPGLPYTRDTISCARNAKRSELVVIMWAGMRGAVSLAAALALPSEFPARDQIIFLTFSVILVTLVAQGLTLAPLIERLAIPDDGGALREQHDARIATVVAAQSRLEELSREDWAHDEAVSHLAGHLDARLSRLNGSGNGLIDDPEESVAEAFARLQIEVVDAQMSEAFRLRDQGRINDATLRVIQRELDLERLRLEQT